MTTNYGGPVDATATEAAATIPDSEATPTEDKTEEPEADGE